MIVLLPIVGAVFYDPLFLQVISTALAHFTRGMPPLTMKANTKVPADFWGKGGTVHYSLHREEVEFTFPKSSDGEMLLYKGDFISGVLDKAVFGKFGLVHAVQVLSCSNVLIDLIIAVDTLHILLCLGLSRKHLRWRTVFFQSSWHKKPCACANALALFLYHFCRKLMQITAIC